MDVSLHVSRRGPIFDGRASAAAAAFCTAAEDEVAQEALDSLQSAFAQQTFRRRTGYYESRVHVERAGPGAVVTDGGVVYGPWLEGTSTRNRSTRFKGYANWRRTAAAFRARAGRVAERVLPPYLRRMG